MRKVKLPLTLDPVKAAQRRDDYDGVVPVTELTRLMELSLTRQGEVDVQLHCGVDPQGLVFTEGKAAVELELECQRCNKPMSFLAEVNFAYTPVFAKTVIEELPEAYEPVDFDENGEIDLRKLIEDELILALPLVAMHAEDQCAVSSSEMSFGKIAPADERPNPFAVLEQLKKK
ncbi:23S rRNA accumulation protein YceD [Gallaecimonas mangrovi]|uniref:23S rRNA accumulation protein YceD n=1 Tax=Gallaecimonas mangrovi TaxID=2291597 RepID=UPI000E20C090|nr:23S rRNA accumulation protein YceD [Gallaecimonas mangrovi]